MHLHAAQLPASPGNAHVWREYEVGAVLVEELCAQIPVARLKRHRQSEQLL